MATHSSSLSWKIPWTEVPGGLRSIGMQKVRQDWSNLAHKQGDNIQLWCTPFPILNQSVVPYLVLTIASLPVHRFLRKQVTWSGAPISLRIFQLVGIHTVKGFNADLLAQTPIIQNNITWVVMEVQGKILKKISVGILKDWRHITVWITTSLAMGPKMWKLSYYSKMVEWTMAN